jgi:hypothetical protein
MKSSPLWRLCGAGVAERALQEIAVDLRVVLADRCGELVEEPAVALCRTGDDLLHDHIVVAWVGDPC